MGGWFLNLRVVAEDVFVFLGLFDVGGGGSGLLGRFAFYCLLLLQFQNRNFLLLDRLDIPLDQILGKLSFPLLALLRLRILLPFLLLLLFGTFRSGLPLSSEFLVLGLRELVLRLRRRSLAEAAKIAAFHRSLIETLV